MTRSTLTRAAMTVAWLALATTSAGAQTLTHRYELDGSFADALGGPAMVGVAGGILGPTGYTFDENEGPSLTGAFGDPDGAGPLAAGSVYSIEMYFRLNSLQSHSAPGAGVWNSYIALVDFKNGGENALYSDQGRLDLWGYAETASPVISANAMTHLVITRSSLGMFNAFVNGVLRLSYNDAAARATTFSAVGNRINFLNDNASENGAGFLDFVRIYDAPVSGAQVQSLYAARNTPFSAVPEPGTWALLGTGLAALGAVARRRRTA